MAKYGKMMGGMHENGDQHLILRFLEQQLVSRLGSSRLLPKARDCYAPTEKMDDKGGGVQMQNIIFRNYLVQ